jgi:hypothetical protein
MNGNPFHYPLSRLLALFGALALVVPLLHAQETTQQISLVAGWNAVWLEVEPQDASGQPLPPTSVFNTSVNTAITVIASPKPLTGLAEFFGDAPASESGTFNSDGWEQWLKVDPAGASDLVMTTGNRGYLIKSDSDITFDVVNGKARFFRPKWTPDRYNLVGFGIDGAVPLSFSDFFASAGTTHPLTKIYTLAAGGAWAPVTAGSNITDGQAYWIFSAGPSDFMGPVSVDFDNAITGRLNFGGPDDAVAVLGPSPATTVAGNYDIKEITFTNRRGSAVTPSLTRLVDGQVILAEVSPDPTILAQRKSGDVGASYTTSEMPVGVSSFLSLGASASRQWAAPAERSNLYRLNTGGGNRVYLPVSASNSSLPALPNGNATASTSVGLWVGEVSIDAVTSSVENGEPVRPSAGSAPIRVILHSKANGDVRLLSQVTVMQTKTADPEVVAVPVLVVDPARIPFFEGAKERNGKRVGLRIQTVAYDMPRKFDAANQAALLADPAYPELVDEAGIAAFLDGRSARPPSLQEKYHLTWPLTGEVGSGKSVSTPVAAPLTLDPFHRSNPFRHAYHEQHVRGPNITRSMQIVFDSDQTIPNRLSGTFTDSLQGLTQTNILLTGRIEMRRVSKVPTLEGAQ